MKKVLLMMVAAFALCACSSVQTARVQCSQTGTKPCYLTDGIRSWSWNDKDQIKKAVDLINQGKATFPTSDDEATALFSK